MRVVYCFLLLWTLAASAYLDWKWPLEITRVDIKLLGGNTFKRISEYFTDNENSQGKVIVRTNPARRDGLYMVIRLNHDTEHMPEGTTIRVEYVLVDNPEVQTHTLVLPRVRAFEVYFGFTDAAWSDKKPSDIICWRIVIEDPQRKVMAERSSVLWRTD